MLVTIGFRFFTFSDNSVQISSSRYFVFGKLYYLTEKCLAMQLSLWTEVRILNKFSAYTAFDLCHRPDKKHEARYYHGQNAVSLLFVTWCHFNGLTQCKRGERLFFFLFAMDVRVIPLPELFALRHRIIRWFYFIIFPSSHTHILVRMLLFGSCYFPNISLPTYKTNRIHVAAIPIRWYIRKKKHYIKRDDVIWDDHCHQQ